MRNIKSDLKIIVVGNSNTGKTSYVNKWTKNEFKDKYKATILSEYSYKIFEHNGNIYRIQIWDLAGQDKNTTMTKVFCKDSHGVIILSDITDPTSLEATLKWKKTIDESVSFFDGSPLPMMLVQNKSDLVKIEDENNKEIVKNEVKDFSIKNGFARYYQTSVKLGINVTESITDFLREVIKRTESLKKEEIDRYSDMVKQSIILNRNFHNGKEKSKKSKSFCC